jgi:tetratricopeptide (TPR) repeat protein
MKRFVAAASLVFLVSASAVAQTQDPEFVKAQTLESQGKLDDARGIYESLYSARPNDLYFWKLVDIYERLGDFRAMERIALAKLKAYQGDLTTLNYLSRAYHGQGDEERARKVLLDSIGENWSDMDRVRNAANEFQIRNDLGSAVGIYQLARVKTGNPLVYALDLARLYTVQMNYPKALEEYLKIIDISPPALANVEQMLKTPFSSQADSKELIRLLENYLITNPASVKAGRLLFTLKERLGDIEGAVSAVLKASVAAGNSAEIWNLAEEMNAEGLPGEALSAYDVLSGKFPSDPNRGAALLKSASIRMSLGDSTGAKRDYQTLISEHAGRPEASLAALRIMELAGEEAGLDITGKLKTFAESAADRTVAYEAYLLLAEKRLRAGNTREAIAAVAQARLKARSNREVYDSTSKAAMIRFYSGEFGEMAREIETCVANLPEGDEANDLLSLRLLYLRASTGVALSPSGRHPKLFNEQLGDPSNGMRSFGAYAHGRFALFRGMEREGVDSLTYAFSDTASAVAPEAARALGAWWRDRGESEKALEWYSRAIAAARDTTVHVACMMEAADLCLKNIGDRVQAKRLYVGALTEFPGSVFEAELRSRLRSVTEKE